MKKTLAILLSLAMVLCMIPAAAFATETSSVAAKVTLSQTETVYNGQDQTPEVAVAVNGNAVTGYTTTWTGEERKNAGTYTVNVTGNFTETAEQVAYAGTATFVVRAVDLARATIVVSGDITDADLNPGKTMLKDYSKVKVMQDGKDITANCKLSSSASSSSVRITAETVNPDNKNIISSSKFADFKVKTTLSGYTISQIPEQTYTGNAVEPYVTVKNVSNGYILTKGVDYTVSYNNNINAGSTAQVTVTGIGSYTGTITGQFVIAQKPITSSDISITVADAVYKNGAVVIPDVVVTQGSKTLKLGVDYNLYGSSTQMGTGSVRVEGIGNYNGDVTRTFNIVDASKELRYNNTFIYIGSNYATSYSAYYNGQAQKPDVTVYVGDKKETAVWLSPSSYSVTYSDNVKPGYGKITITGKNGYAGSAQTSFSILETPITSYNTVVTGYNESYAYDGTYHTPVVNVSVNGYSLTNGKDYTVSYTNNKNISTAYSKAKITITAIEGSGYTGTVTKEFSILGKSISSCTASYANGRSSSQYNGTAVIPSIIVRDGYYTTLKQGTDYTITYRDSTGKVVGSMKEAGKYTVVIKGTGNYSGELTLGYEILGIDISDYTVTLKETSVKANGQVQTPAVVSVKKGVYSSLNSGDYTISYMDSTGKSVFPLKSPGTYKVVVTGKNGYSGSAYATFRIVGTPQELNVGKTSYKVYKDSESFKITAKWTGDGTGVTYVSSNPEVATVSPSGVVTIHKIGRAKITVTTTGMKLSEPTSEEVFVKVYPDKTKITQKPQTEGNKGSFRVRWEKQDDVTYYEIRYARNSSFQSGTYLTKTVKASDLNYTTQSTKISNLKSGAKYYVKVRAVKVVTNEYGQQLKYNGTWSNWRSVVTK
ncbi:MAG: fibronectin type III domain-containing protein [Firmicutes bacterium]|nr:fibronectin type III domain-containing protein [Bacillota bacterium]MDY5857312.1 fibronectin type III domain-containing protein [Anaerovoracaceae bacterium]